MNLGLKFVIEQFCPFFKKFCPLSAPIINADNVYLESRNLKMLMHCVMSLSHRTNSNYVAQKLSNFFIFFFVQRINWNLTKKRDLNKISTMFMGREKRECHSEPTLMPRTAVLSLINIEGIFIFVSM